MSKKKKAPLQIILLVIFFIMYVPYIYTWIVATDSFFNGTNSGIFGQGPRYYGLSAMVEELTWGVIVFCGFVPVIEVSLLYQSIYIAVIFNKYRDSDRIKLARKWFDILGVSSVLVSCGILLFFFFNIVNARWINDILYLLLCIILPIAACYLLTRASLFIITVVRKKLSSVANTGDHFMGRKTPLQIILLIIFFIMFVPYIFVWVWAVISISVSDPYKGMPTMIEEMMWLMRGLSPIKIEVSLLYQSIYIAAIINKYRDSDRIKLARKWFNILGVPSVLVSCGILLWGLFNIVDVQWILEILFLLLCILLPIAACYLLTMASLLIIAFVRRITLP